jgi:hypothetical protein
MRSDTAPTGEVSVKLPKGREASRPFSYMFPSGLCNSRQAERPDSQNDRDIKNKLTELFLFREYPAENVQKSVNYDGVRQDHGRIGIQNGYAEFEQHDRYYRGRDDGQYDIPAGNQKLFHKQPPKCLMKILVIYRLP